MIKDKLFGALREIGASCQVSMDVAAVCLAKASVDLPAALLAHSSQRNRQKNVGGNSKAAVLATAWSPQHYFET